LKDADVLLMFALTLVMDSNFTGVLSLFGHWASKNLDEVKGPCGEDWKDGVEESTRYGYIAEEICCN
jgi:hypothetical protein